LSTAGMDSMTIASVSEDLKNILLPTSIDNDTAKRAIILSFASRVASANIRFETIPRHHFEGDLAFVDVSSLTPDERAQSDRSRTGTMLIRYRDDTEHTVHLLDKVVWDQSDARRPTFYKASQSLGGRYEDGVRLFERETGSVSSTRVTRWTAAENRIERVGRSTSKYPMTGESTSDRLTADARPDDVSSEDGLGDLERIARDVDQKETQANADVPHDLKNEPLGHESGAWNDDMDDEGSARLSTEPTSNKSVTYTSGFTAINDPLGH
jgi:hypothetical protein